MLRRYIAFLDKVLPSFLAIPALYLIVSEYREHLAGKLPSPSPTHTESI